MTLYIGTTRASSLSTSGESNNPFFAWNNRAARSGASYSSSPTADAAGPLANAFDGNTYDFAQLTMSGTSGNITIDLGTDIAISFAAIAAHNLGTAGGGVGTLRPLYSTDNITFSICDGITAKTVADDSTIGFYFDTITARYWRFSFASYTASDVLQLGVVFFGNPVTLPQRIYQGYRPPLTPTEVDMTPEISEGGHFLGSTVVRRGSTASPEFSHIDPTFFRGASWLGFQEAWNDGNPAFWAWRPTKYATDHDLHYAQRSGAAIAPTNSGPIDLMSVSVPMRIFHEDWR